MHYFINLLLKNCFVLEPLILSELVCKAEFDCMMYLFLEDLKLKHQVFTELFVLVHQINPLIFCVLIVIERNFVLVLALALVENSQ